MDLQYEPFGRNTVLLPGHNEITIELRRGRRLILVVKHMRHEVDWRNRYFSLQFFRLDKSASGGQFSCFCSPGRWKLPPGRYEIEIPEFPGYRPVPRFQVDIRPREFVTRIIELEKNWLPQVPLAQRDSRGET
ncbi:MAG: hypothetical protein AB1486_21185 [Planctomycetota bacterium]